MFLLLLLLLLPLPLLLLLLLLSQQGGCGSCVSFATTVLTEFALMKRNSAYTAANTDLSEDDLMECERECGSSRSRNLL
jgi:hypothetical protein